MGGTDVTSSVYSNGVISVPRVTGNIVITASGYYTGDYIDLVGYDADCRLGTSDGNTRSMSGSIAVKHISFSRAQTPVYKITGVNSAGSWANIIAFYDESSNFVTYISLQNLSGDAERMQNIGVSIVINGTETTIAFQANSASVFSSIAKWRVSLVGSANDIEIKEIV
jgi:hypothetical protein